MALPLNPTWPSTIGGARQAFLGARASGAEILNLAIISGINHTALHSLGG